MPSNLRGYLTPTSSDPLPGSLSLEDFIQSVIVGISGYNGTLVRPKWQTNPPKQPGITTNWIAFAIANIIGDSNAYTGLTPGNVDILQRNESLEIQVAFYGPNAQENVSAFRDGFQIQQNLEALRLANMGFTGTTSAIRGPDIVNERWVDRYELTLILNRMVQRVYPVLSFASVLGSIHTVIANVDIDQSFEAEDP